MARLCDCPDAAPLLPPGSLPGDAVDLVAPATSTLAVSASHLRSTVCSAFMVQWQSANGKMPVLGSLVV